MGCELSCIFSRFRFARALCACQASMAAGFCVFLLVSSLAVTPASAAPSEEGLVLHATGRFALDDALRTLAQRHSVDVFLEESSYDRSVLASANAEPNPDPTPVMGLPPETFAMRYDEPTTLWEFAAVVQRVLDQHHAHHPVGVYHIVIHEGWINVLPENSIFDSGPRYKQPAEFDCWDLFQQILDDRDATVANGYWTGRECTYQGAELGQELRAYELMNNMFSIPSAVHFVKAFHGYLPLDLQPSPHTIWVYGDVSMRPTPSWPFLPLGEPPADGPGPDSGFRSSSPGGRALHQRVRERAFLHAVSQFAFVGAVFLEDRAGSDFAGRYLG